VTAAIEVRQGGERFVSRADGRESRYSFSYAEHYDAANTHHGLLLAHNDETLAPGAGYDEHRHRDLEIVTWVLTGTLTHRDSSGASHEVPAGWVQVMSAGSGVTHSETNEHAKPVRYVQMWVAPDGSGENPGYERHELAAGRLTPAVVLPGQPKATFLVARPDSAGLELPDAAFLHLFVATGRVDLDGDGSLEAGDAARLTGAGPLHVTGEQGSEIGVWAMSSSLGG
jgi:redox-sensitive bicupin YhaK (pirin superfamily)